MDLAVPAAARGPAREAVRSERVPGPTIWAVASGKGGVGKSVLCASLAIGLSQTGPRAVAVDLDLGGANLHSLFGCGRARHTLTDFLRGRVKALGDALTDTTVPGVRLLSGARGALDIANASHAHKQKILRGLKRIDAGHVVLDLGAGSHFHTLDAFLAADRRILVVTPEATSIENAYHFLKAAFFRALREVARAPEVHAALASVLDEARRSGATPRELVEAASRADVRVGALLRARMRVFDVDLVVNRSDEARGRDPGAQIAATGRASLGANLRLAAALPTDASVPVAVERGVPVMQLFPGSRFCRDVGALVARLCDGEPPQMPRADTPAPAPVTAAPAAPRLPAFDGSSPGRHLRRCRERQGLDLAELHERTRIRHRHLESIEVERFDALPGDFYLRAYVRQVAQALGLPDAEAIAQRFVECARAGREVAAPQPPARRPVPSTEELMALFDDELELGGRLESRPTRSEPQASEGGPLHGLGEPACEPAPAPLRVVSSAAELASYLGPAAAERASVRDRNARARRRRRARR
jgi:flagellar biosynthesis protein FlhG